MKEKLKEMIDAGVPFEIHETIWSGGITKTLFGLRWGGSALARELGFKRKEVIEVLNWADKNVGEALNVFTSDGFQVNGQLK